MEHGHPRELGCEPVGDLARPVRRAVVDDEHAVLRRVEHLAERPIIGSRFSRSLYVGRQRTARGIAISSRDAQDAAPERRARGPARPPRRPLGDPRGGVVQGHRVPAGGGTDQGVALPIAQLAIDGKAKELPGIGKTIETKVVEVVEDGEMHALARRRGQVPAGVVEFLRLPGVGPKTAARIWTQLGITSLDGLKAPRRRAGCAISRGWARRARRRSSRRSRPESAPSRRSGGCSRWRFRRCGASSPSSRRIPRRSRCRRPEASAVAARRCGISTSSRRRATRRRSSKRSAAATGSPRSPRAATRRRRSSATTRSASICGSCRRSATATSSSTSRARGTTTSRCARMRSGAGSRSRSTASRTSRPERSSRTRARTSSTTYLGYRTPPPELREGTHEIAAARDGDLPALVEVGDLRARCTATRPGRRTRGARSRRWRSRRRRAATGSSASPTTRTTCATGGSRRSGRRSRSSTGG